MSKYIVKTQYIFTLGADKSGLSAASLIENMKAFNSISKYRTKIVWSVFQLEKGKQNDYLHYQGFVKFNNAINLNTVKKLIFNDTNYVHLASAFASVQKNYEYCTKLETRVEDPVEYGVRPSFRTQGRRTDLDDLVIWCSNVENDVSIENIIFSFPSLYARYSKFCDKLISMNRPVERPPITFYWIYGESGTGKSSYAKELVPDDESFYLKASPNAFFDYYNGEKYMILDNVNADWDLIKNPSELITLSDIHKTLINVKHGTATLLAHTIIVTSIHHPLDIVPQQNQLEVIRRIGVGGKHCQDHLIHLTESKLDSDNLKEIEATFREYRNSHNQNKK